MAAGVCDQVVVQVSYAIGVVEPMGIFVDTYGSGKVNKSDGEIAEIVSQIFDMRPGIIEQRLKLRNPLVLRNSSLRTYGTRSRIEKSHFSNLLTVP